MKSTETRRLLVVDDEPDMTKGLRRILKLQGYEVHIANSGEEAIGHAREWDPDGILMDLKMPGMDGVETYRNIRAICPNAFVIFMTAFSSMVQQARDEGAVDVLTKPLDPANMCDLIAKALVTRPVLIVDDDADFCESLSRIFKTKGCNVQTAQTAEQALALFEKQPRSVVLLDMKLEGATGLELLRRLKERNKKTTVIQMSGFDEMEGPMQQGMGLCATACFRKPLDIDGVFAVIDASLSSQA